MTIMNRHTLLKLSTGASAHPAKVPLCVLVMKVRLWEVMHNRRSSTTSMASLKGARLEGPKGQAGLMILWELDMVCVCLRIMVITLIDA